MYILKIRISDNCNQDCGYCTTLKGVGGKTELSIENINKYIELYIKEDVCLEITGGEPFLYKDIANFINKVNCKTVNINTNLSMSVNFFSKFVKKVNKKIKVAATYHHGQTDLIEFIKKCKDLDGILEIEEILVMYENKRSLKNYRIMKGFFGRGVVSIEPIINPWLDNRHTDVKTDEEFIKNGYIDLNGDQKKDDILTISEEINNKGKICQIAKKTITIDYDGRTDACTQVYNPKNSGRFNINSEVERVPNEVVCKWDKCLYMDNKFANCKENIENKKTQ
jgi:hypothetical protein